MAEYTPTTSEVMAAYVIGEHLTQPVFPVAETEQCFRNWLAEHDRVVAEKAWDEGALATRLMFSGPSVGLLSRNPYRTTREEAP